MTNPDAAVHIRDLHKHYGETRAVDGLDLQVEAGEIFAVLGPNGAGKTTTVEILEGYRRRDSGEVRVLGTDPADADRHWRTRIGIVLQNIAEQPDLTVKEMVHHFARYYPNPQDPDRLIGTVGLADKANARVRQLSGGQRRRLDVALGIVGDPELLFLDEPTTGFDPAARRAFWELIHQLRDDGTTILLTTHYLDEAENLADRVAVVSGGRVVALDTPAQLGGRAGGQAVVRWEENSEHREITTDAPMKVITDLAARFDDGSGEIPGLQVIRPSLEDVYLSLLDETERADAVAAAEESA